VINRRSGNRARLGDVTDPYGRFSAFINDGRRRLEQTLASVVYFGHRLNRITKN
jgi:hypothetical protein